MENWHAMNFASGKHSMMISIAVKKKGRVCSYTLTQSLHGNGMLEGIQTHSLLGK